ncbi:CRISPR-associated helicase/endonuclease Cas3 [Microbacterium sp. No. 7]|uniref:CRISPR-associated helicase/endonuclease Cas3 n=1 Tax=Microbacterium sp. No. 7 TaxID=1714373 RepID=UPI0006D11DD6|nr:CRISPR-associated helicase/endonuclease Cas3 [Microbacterium sp. No. 7]ALJ18538.1 hypothetical protein AOA12_00845 [Microbacterium sp. No. 7]
MPHTTPPSLSDRALTVWAKSFLDHADGHALVGWLPLHQHLADAAGVAARLWDEWAPRSIKDLLSRSVGSDEAARSQLVWLAGTHDIGKTSPAFAVQVGGLADGMRRAGLVADPRIRDDDQRRSTRHELVSFLAIRAHLRDRHGFDADVADRIASVAAAHHGRPADAANIRAAQDLPHFIGEGPWIETRDELLHWADGQFTDGDSIRAWRDSSLTQPALVVLSALVIVADWIASSDLFPSAPLGAQPTETTDARVTRAWSRLGFPGPWHAQPESTDAAALLAARFDLPDDATPHATQIALVEQALRLERPELLILEAEMGSGKTEAALLAAEILAGRFGTSGIFVGLPTQATSDGMFSRVLAWADRLRLDTPSSVFLARSRAQLNEEYAQLVEETSFRSIAPDNPARDDTESDTSSLIAHRWFSDSRRGPLSSFVVGTVDQALFAGLRSRYLMLRHLALAGKVVIIDEVHAYDDYMDRFLTRVLEWLGAYETPVILLSATLPSQKRRDYIAAYDRGRRSLQPSPPRVKRSWSEKRRAQDAGEPTPVPYPGIGGLIGYPAITVSNGTEAPTVATPAASSAPRRVLLGRIDDDESGLAGLLRDALADGGNVAVIRNTVRRAQETAAVLREMFPDIPVTVAHSRYLGVDRARKDRELLGLYGRHGARPPRSIVVATQVIEQSLDVDFDLLVSDVAPIDLLLQRTGRMHRHHRADRPEALRTPRLVITGVDWSTNPPGIDRGSSVVYGEALLLRTLAAVRERDALTLPDDIAPLVEQVYGDDADFIPDDWMPAHDEAVHARREEIADKQRRAQTFALGAVTGDDPSLIGWIRNPDEDPDFAPPGRATVRDTEETLEVVVVQRGSDGILRTPAWLEEHGGEQIPDNEPPDAALTRTLLGCFLRLPAGMCHGNALDRHISELERTFELPSWHASHALKGELTLVFDEDGYARLNEFDLFYSFEDGLDYQRRT